MVSNCKKTNVGGYTPVKLNFLKGGNTVFIVNSFDTSAVKCKNVQGWDIWQSE